MTTNDNSRKWFFALSIAVMVVVSIFEWTWPANYFWSYGFTLAVVLAAGTRSKIWIWILCGLSLILTYVDAAYGPPSTFPQAPVYFNRSIGAGALLLMTIVVTAFMQLRTSIEQARSDAEARNRDLELREEEIARQNEELQSQSEELERQSEELRVANEELAQRESMLETMLDLSRALTVELTQGQIMERICETLWHLINGADSATAILLKEGDDLNVKCHYGFGAEGISAEPVPYRDSFASLIISQMRSGYVEDLSLRPDLKFPRPASGEPMQAILAAPLLVRGRAVGTLEIYSRVKRSWSEEQVALAESLAAQAAISLENGMLFEEVERERGRLGTVLRAVPFGLLICDENCTNIRANPAGAAMLSVPVDTSMSSTEAFSHITAIEGGRTLAIDEHPIVLAARHGRETHGQESEWILPGGRRIHVLISAVPVRERDGNVIGAVSVKADITQMKLLQREIDLRRREAEEANVRKTRFLAAASHDIRTPANAISLLAELIKRTAENPSLIGETRQLASELHASSLSLVDLVTNVLDVTRFDTDKLELRESDFPLGALVEEEVRQAMPLAEAKKIKLAADRVNPPVWLRADRIKLGRIVGNLLSNAIKFTDEGNITLSAGRTEDGGIVISVTDTGVGIAPEHLGKIFDEFYQISDPSRSKGSGLGLAISKRLVEAMGGEIRVASEHRKGSTFAVILPASVVIPRAEAAVTAR
ncbi:MAG TPA: ATP-binding protein [Tepidisphaeraceae bacterium]|jgi:signal transduction histidine kinase